jgi:hypothetical protein
MAKRRLLLGLALASPLLLAACNLSAAQVSSEVVTDSNLIAGAFKTAMTELESSGLSAATVATASTYINDALSVEAGLSASMVATAALPVVQQFLADVSATFNTLNPLPISAALRTIIMSAETLIPVIQIAAGILLTPSQKAKAVSTGMSADQARLNLRAAAAK